MNVVTQNWIIIIIGANRHGQGRNLLPWKG